MSMHTVIHLGSGLCRELDDYLAQAPRRVLLIEADPDTSEQLRRRTADQATVEVRCLALAARSGPATLHRYNLPEANSLHPAEGLQQLFPGLRLLETVELEARDVVGVIDALDLEADAEHLLVIELPGEDVGVLEALHAADLLSRFRHLRLHSGLEPLYRGSVPAMTLVEWLKARGFDLVERDDRDDPDQPYWLFTLNPLKLEQAALRKQIETLTAEKAALTKDKTALAAARDEQTKLAAERQTQIATLKTQLQEQQNRVTQLESELAERDQRQAFMDEELHKAEGQIELIKDLLLRPDTGL